MLDIQIEGGVDELRDLADRLDRLGRQDMLRALERAIRSAANPLPAAALKGTSRLPRRGGLGQRVRQADIPVVAGVSGVTVSAIVSARPGLSTLKDLAAIDRGRVRHPVYGHWTRKPLIQHVHEGWFTEPIMESRNDIRDEILKAIRDVIAKI